MDVGVDIAFNTSEREGRARTGPGSGARALRKAGSEPELQGHAERLASASRGFSGGWRFAERKMLISGGQVGLRLK